MTRDEARVLDANAELNREIAALARRQHRWSGWPGAWCLDCGADDPREIALADGRIDFVDDSDRPHGFRMMIEPHVQAEIEAAMLCAEPGSDRCNPYARAREDKAMSESPAHMTTDEPEPVTGEPTQADIVRDAVRAVIGFAKHAADIPSALHIQLGIVCGAAMRSLDHWPSDASDTTTPPEPLDLEGEFDG